MLEVITLRACCVLQQCLLRWFTSKVASTWRTWYCLRCHVTSPALCRYCTQMLSLPQVSSPPSSLHNVKEKVILERRSQSSTNELMCSCYANSVEGNSHQGHFDQSVAKQQAAMHCARWHLSFRICNSLCGNGSYSLAFYLIICGPGTCKLQF